MSAHYANEANVGRLVWASTDTKVKMQPPKMAVVPLTLVHFLLEQPRLLNKLYNELEGGTSSN